MNRIGRERGWPPTSRAHFDARAAHRERSSSAALLRSATRSWPRTRSSASTASDPDGHRRYRPLKLMKAIEILATRVAPEVRKAVAAQR
jgi:hypothetical protein